MQDTGREKGPTHTPLPLRLISRKVWDADLLQRGDFLGEARLTKEDLAANIPVDGMHEFTMPLEKKPTATNQFNKMVQGSLRVTCQVNREASRHGSIARRSMDLLSRMTWARVFR